MRAALSLSALLLLGACAGAPTEKRWSCAPGKGPFRSCASIGEIDARSNPQPLDRGGVTLRSLTGASPSYGPSGAQRSPVREGDAVLRIVVAPWIDAAGDYHARSDIFAVVRRGGWTVPVPPPPPPPPPSSAAPKIGEAQP